MFIDVHTHAYRLPPRFPMTFPSTEELIAYFDQNDIEAGCVLPIVNSEIYLPQANEDILEMAQRYPSRIIPFCNIDPRALTNSPFAKLEKVLSYYKDLGCRGVGEIMPNLRTDDDRVQNLFRAAEKTGLPVTWDGSDRTHSDFGLYDDPGLPQFAHTLARFPELTVFAHGPVFWAELGRLPVPAQRKPAPPMYDQRQFNDYSLVPPEKVVDEGVVPKMFRTYPNLLGELSDAFRNLRRDPEFGAAFLTEFQDRLYFGSDFCNVNTPQSAVREMLINWRKEQLISETVFKKIARENAIKFFNLPL